MVELRSRGGGGALPVCSFPWEGRRLCVGGEGTKG